MSFIDLARERYSLKNYDGRPVEPWKLQTILEAGNVAPTACNAQPQRVYVLQSEEALAKANELTNCIFGSTTVLMMTYKEKEAYHYPSEAYFCSGAEDVAIVATHYILEARDLGVGSCWVNRFDPLKAQELFGLDEDEIPVLLMPLGYPAEGAGPLPKHTIKKALDETVKYL